MKERIVYCAVGLKLVCCMKICLPAVPPLRWLFAGLSPQNPVSIAGQSMWDLWQSGSGTGFSPSTYLGFSLGQDISVGIATRYGLSGLEIESRWGVRFSTAVQIGPGAHPGCRTKDTGSLPEVKRPGRDVNHPLSSSAKVKERVEQEFLTFFWVMDSFESLVKSKTPSQKKKTFKCITQR
jgi:hypothetical protein